MNIGARYLGSQRCAFTVWAPGRRTVHAHILGPADRLIQMEKDDDGYWHATAERVPPGTRYRYLLDNSVERPDPASFFQPEGVHGPSAVIDHAAYAWRDSSWKGTALSDMIFYEFHAGTFTREGTFDAAVGKLHHLCSLGVTAVEIMPVAQFPGSRNWGYDGVFPFAVQCSYGGVDGLKRFVDACHGRGLAVVLDVVYNHLGSEGNCLGGYAPYFTKDKYRTPWGRAVNFDGAYSDQVREYFITNALYWLEHYHVDALRLDAVHAIMDFSAKHILQELAERAAEFNSAARFRRFLIAESDLNDSRLIRRREQGGYGLDAQWSDDFHHALHTVLTGEKRGYYVDFGEPAQLVKAMDENYVYSGQYSAFRGRRHGNSAADLPPDLFVVCSQNHDQVGNRMLGERLGALVDFESLKCAAAIVLLAPQIPLLFMGEEWGERAPFLYFVSHGDQELVEAVRRGRKEEYKGFVGEEEPPDPQDEATFFRSKISWNMEGAESGRLLNWYCRLIELRRATGGADAGGTGFKVKKDASFSCFCLRRRKHGRQILALINFMHDPVRCPVDTEPGDWRKILDSSDQEWGGPGVGAAGIFSAPALIGLNGRSVAVYEQRAPAQKQTSP